MQKQKIEPDVVTYSTLIDAFVKMRKGEHALAFFEKMRKEGIEPDMITRSCILDAFVILNRIDEGQKNLINWGFEPRIKNKLLDCHDQSHGVALLQILLFIEKHPQNSYQVITGKGLHSKCGIKSAMRDFIVEYFDNNKPDFIVQDNNEGCLIIEKLMGSHIEPLEIKNDFSKEESGQMDKPDKIDFDPSRDGDSRKDFDNKSSSDEGKEIEETLKVENNEEFLEESFISGKPSCIIL